MLSYVLNLQRRINHNDDNRISYVYLLDSKVKIVLYVGQFIDKATNDYGVTIRHVWQIIGKTKKFLKKH